VKTYIITFKARRIGSIGVSENFTMVKTTNNVINETNILPSIYEHYEHVSDVAVKTLPIHTDTIGDHVNVDRDIEKRVIGI
jgi:hypothetical protein